RGVLIDMAFLDVAEPAVERVAIATYDGDPIRLVRGPDGWALDWSLLGQWPEERSTRPGRRRCARPARRVRSGSPRREGAGRWPFRRLASRPGPPGCPYKPDSARDGA